MTDTIFPDLTMPGASDQGTPTAAPPTTARAAHDVVSNAAKTAKIRKATTTRNAKARTAKATATPKAGGGDLRRTEENPAKAVTFGLPGVASYGTACSEIFTQYFQQTAQRQTDMLTNMRRAYAPGEMMLAGNKYLLGGLRDYLAINMKIFMASARGGATRS
jgi:hypothetical protein